MPLSLEKIPGQSASEASERSERQAVMAQLQRINAALAAWEMWAWNADLPAHLQREVQQPPLSPDALKSLRRTLLRSLSAVAA